MRSGSETFNCVSVSVSATNTILVTCGFTRSDGFYSALHARDVYGVVVDVEQETVDVEATAKARAALAKAS